MFGRARRKDKLSPGSALVRGDVRNRMLYSREPGTGSRGAGRGAGDGRDVSMFREGGAGDGRDVSMFRESFGRLSAPSWIHGSGLLFARVSASALAGAYTLWMLVRPRGLTPSPFLLLLAVAGNVCNAVSVSKCLREFSGESLFAAALIAMAQVLWLLFEENRGKPVGLN